MRNNFQHENYEFSYKINAQFLIVEHITAGYCFDIDCKKELHK